MYKKKLNKIKKESNSKLEKHVVNYIVSNYSEEEIPGFIKDLLQHGCQSGMVGELISYYDTVKFYKKFQPEIDSLLKEMFFQTGYKSPMELFGDKWDEDDPLGRDDMNMNLLAWFGFEETVRKIADELAYEY
jgi:hypothetical protein